MTLLNELPDEELVAEPDTAAGGQGGDGQDNGNNGAAAAAEAMPGNVRPSDIVGEMQNAYLDYAMSVIVSRALPDVRDGLKPVHRRILYAMSHDLYLHHTKPHRKSARIVGEVLGKYHPHGDVAVYDAMVRMAQEFSLRYPLVDGQGNFGSIDGDGAAAMRYTEARLAEIAELMLADLDKDTVDWHDNFDNSLEEPDILPAALPNLLINGSSGIAVGMATNIPPHNLGEIVDALVYLIDRYKEVEAITVDELMQFVKGPDFPTGGILYRFREEKSKENIDVITQGYGTGKARLVMQAKAHFEEMSRGRSRIVVTELPYQTNKTALIERIATLVRDGKIEGITDLRDESDRTGMRIVIELTRNAEPKDILKDLFKYTPLQQTFGMQMLALVDGQPRLLSLKRALYLFVQHREEIIRRRSEYDLAKARDRAHIVEGLLKALDLLDEVIDTIRRSQTVETARKNLVKNFDFTEIQAQAILDMQLRRLAALERKKLKDEYDELMERIAYLEDLLAHPEKILAVIREDLLAQKEKYGDARRTQIVDRTKGTLTSTDLLPQQEVWVTVSADGELRRQDVAKPDVATLRKLAKYGQVAMLTANTRDWLYLFCRDGRCTRVPIHELPQNGTPKHVAELTEWSRRDMVTAAISIPRISAEQAQGYLFLATALGDVKRISMADFVSNTNAEFSVMAVGARDRLGWVLPTPGEQEAMLITSAGQSIRFSEEDVRSMGLAAGGVGGMKLKKNDLIIHADIISSTGEGTVVTMTAKGYAKRSDLSEYSRQGRNGSGIVTHKPSGRTGQVAAAMVLPGALADEELIASITAKRKVEPLRIEHIPVMGRNVQGKQVLELSTSDEVVALKRIIESTTPTDQTPDSSPDSGNGGNGNSDNGTGDSGSSASRNGTVSGTNGSGPSARRGSTRKQAAATALKSKAASTGAANSNAKTAKTVTSKTTSTKKLDISAKVGSANKKSAASRKQTPPAQEAATLSTGRVKTSQGRTRTVAAAVPLRDPAAKTTRKRKAAVAAASAEKPVSKSADPKTKTNTDAKSKTTPSKRPVSKQVVSDESVTKKQTKQPRKRVTTAASASKPAAAKTTAVKHRQPKTAKQAEPATTKAATTNATTQKSTKANATKTKSSTTKSTAKQPATQANSAKAKSRRGRQTKVANVKTVAKPTSTAAKKSAAKAADAKSTSAKSTKSKSTNTTTKKQTPATTKSTRKVTATPAKSRKMSKEKERKLQSAVSLSTSKK